ncbi:MAG: hypothetical protein Q9224_005201 [Gallowayella concinna]
MQLRRVKKQQEQSDMASTVLGKRARAATASNQASLSAPSRIKRLRVERVNDENADPNLSHRIANDSRHNSYDDLEDLEDPFVSSLGRSKPPSKNRAKAPVARRQNSISWRQPKSITHNVPDSTSQRGHSNVRSYHAEDATDEHQTIQVPTPQTPRHRDALSKKVPITPRRLITLGGKTSTPRTPRTPVTPASLLTVYHTARQSFVRSADPGRLVGRDAERLELKAFIQEGIDRRSGRCLYVSGPPGTGKSALVGEVCQGFAHGLELRKAYINCMSVKASGDVHNILFNDLFDGCEGSSFEQSANLQTRLAPSKKSVGPLYLVVLDEIDHLLSLDLEILYTLFDLALRRTSQLILIGIANALDLTDRFLPRLKARNLKPQLLPFLPYSAPQVASVITTKLRALAPTNEGDQKDYIPFVHPMAVQFCSKKVASQTGDLRKAFDIIHRSLTLVENETRATHQQNLVLSLSPSKSPLSENPNLSAPSTPRTLASSLATLNPLTAPRVTIAHIARVAAAALGNGTSQRLQALNLQQKAALCALISLEKHKRSTQRHPILDTPSKSPAAQCPTIHNLYETYCLLCKRDNALHPLTAVEFCDVVGGLETLGLVGEGTAKGLGKSTPSKRSGKREDRRVSSWVSEKEFECCLDGVGGAILRGLLEE